jgi:hypothetical protein
MIIRGQEVMIVGLIARLIMVFASLCNLHSVDGAPSVSDKKLKVQLVAQGLSSPTSIAFIDSKNILVKVDLKIIPDTTTLLLPGTI